MAILSGGLTKNRFVVPCWCRIYNLQSLRVRALQLMEILMCALVSMCFCIPQENTLGLVDVRSRAKTESSPSLLLILKF